VLFNSFQFVLFYLGVLALHGLLPRRLRWILLLASSYVFYMSWRVEYVVLLIGATAINFGAGLALGRTERPAARRALLVLSLCASLGILFVYKYLDFFAESLGIALSAAGLHADLPHWDLILPLGISFYTFQSVGYVIDVYRGATPVERHFGIFALYVSFFPQLIAGPIERSQDLLPQFRNPQPLDRERLANGLQLMLWGAFKKIVIADRVSVVVDTIYANPEAYPGPFLLLATFFFTIQIYCDFSGYSDIAIGSARILGYDLMTNFRRPYLSTSAAEFWRRWHISLSSWFRDYVYKPLGGNRVETPRWVYNTLVVFVVSGLWHGANWTFIAWGTLHGVYLVLAAATRIPRSWLAERSGLVRWPTFHHGLKTLYVFVLMMAGWVFFRAQSIDEAFDILVRSADPSGFRLGTLWNLGLPRFELLMAFVSIGALFAVDGAIEFKPRPVVRLWAHRPLRWGLYLACAYAVVFFGAFGRAEFIYFQF
jgi:D-alanyl-lipoteichoic acid acyltransferase DltB (MBOAT superfamily)